MGSKLSSCCALIYFTFLDHFLGILCDLPTRVQTAAHNRTWENFPFEAGPSLHLLEIFEGGNIQQTVLRFCQDNKVGGNVESCALSLYQSLHSNFPDISGKEVSPQYVIEEIYVDHCLNLTIDITPRPGSRPRPTDIVFDKYDDSTSLAENFCHVHLLSDEDQQVITEVIEHTLQELRLLAGATPPCPAAALRRALHPAPTHAAAEGKGGGDGDGRAYTAVDGSLMPGPSQAHCLRLARADGGNKQRPGGQQGPQAASAAATGLSRTCLLRDLVHLNGEWFFVEEERGGDDGGAAQRAQSWGPWVPLLFASTSSTRSPYRFAPTPITPRELAGLCEPRPWARVPGATALLARYQHDVLGHALHDGVVPLVWALDAHRLLPEGKKNNSALNVVLVDHAETSPFDQWYRLVSPARPPFYAYQFPHLLCPAGSCCIFDQVLTGFEGMGFKWPSETTNEDLTLRLPVYQKFRDLVSDLHQNGLLSAGGVETQESSAVFSDHPASKVFKVAIIQRSNYRKIKNISRLQKKFENTCPFCEIKIVYLEELSFSQQVLLFAGSGGADVVVAVEGTALDQLLYARPGTGVLAISRDTGLEQPYGGEIAFVHERYFELWGEWLSIETLLVVPGSEYILDLEVADYKFRVLLAKALGQEVFSSSLSRTITFDEL